MRWWRGGVGLLLVLTVAPPLLAPLFELLTTPQAWSAWLESQRILALARNTLILVAGTLLFALPLGVVLAVLLFRTDLPGRRVLRFLVLICLFLPLPLLVAGWE